MTEHHADRLGHRQQVRSLSERNVDHLRVDDLSVPSNLTPNSLTRVTAGQQELLHVPHAEEHHLGRLSVHVLHQDYGGDLDGVGVVLPDVGGQRGSARELSPADVAETDLSDCQH